MPDFASQHTDNILYSVQNCASVKHLCKLISAIFVPVYEAFYLMGIYKCEDMWEIKFSDKKIMLCIAKYPYTNL